MSKGKVVLAYSGGLDTSVSIKWLQEQYDYDVIALGLEVGEGKDLEALKEKALSVGADKAVIIDAKELLAEEYLLPALKSNCLYEGKYPLSSALSRPLISKLLVEVAEQEGAVAVAHGCTGKGNDQVRFEVSIQALNPDLEVIAPVREWGMNRDEEIAYAKEKNIPVPVNLEKPYSIDANIWGRACEAGVLEDTWKEAPEEAFDWTASIADAPDTPEYVEIEFKEGKPVALDGQALPLVTIIQQLNELGGKHGIGRIDHIENRLVGIKAREVYENPGALILINAHKEMEFLTLPKEVTQYKTQIDQKMTQLVYDGLWYSPLRTALESFINETQKNVNGKVKVKLWKGTHMVVARDSENSLYNEELATYSKGDAFDHNAAVGFIKLWGLSTKTYSQVNNKKPELVKAEK
ncbi:argininosuccinate synthase [Salipaludibacillus agaradhaerens]|jgi:argininosuccinate synthase|uniref:Argininosuccinate synthase n=1 Tax=Salipaludibacillus agaradhaerens TaxID=76935 RepID=A0A9Q4B0X4_SALAG|nr:argininosuccinate synthase [Salipaludibacillus agaradhaerens]UJW57867.1 argininosuccinate synthase [Bacillus sp. A116_S68]MCR6096338.1 argininosuccinate synthase [Salipaludibacillus agaradhaerens]MCR6106757.1 argininosuccinate synthase [Salipaludibacillus agaradhaerens]MCR6114103.1 argininosuccinate synthase [Salipaludibacillus agaradhaerens]MCR6118789.1 argininosuccinate synthase [Salipaludibacillus agaradhaerens]